MPQANPTGGANSERLENVTFPQARIDINDNLEALQTLNSGNSEPSTKAAFMQWLDTNTDPAVLKIRNAGNTSWIEVGSLSATEYASKGLTAIANGGTGQVTAAAAIAALLPNQSGNSGKSLTTDGSALSWALSSIFNSYTFDYTGSTQTWTKPTTGNLALIFIWGGGGSGATNDAGNGDSGGGGGGCCFGIFPLSQLGSSVSITIGAGGYQSSNDEPGQAGGNSTFGGTGDSFYLKANGGEGGVETGRGGYGGQIYDMGYADPAYPTIGGFAGGSGGAWHSGGVGTGSIFGGAGGSNGNTGSATYSSMGGRGGRGGGGTGSSGAGGDGTTSTGSVPGGGGGGRANNGSPYGAGGHGQCKIYVI
jgi:hypothetical protein